MIEVAFLPQSAARDPGECEARTLFGEVDEVAEIGVVGLGLDEGVQMLRHEAVHKNCKPFGDRDSQNLLEHESDGVGVSELAVAQVRANGEEVLADADIRARIEATGTAHQRERNCNLCAVAGSKDPAYIKTGAGSKDPAYITTGAGSKDPAYITTGAGSKDPAYIKTGAGSKDPAYIKTGVGSKDPASGVSPWRRACACTIRGARSRTSRY